jgi:hypothetical protein
VCIEGTSFKLNLRHKNVDTNKLVGGTADLEQLVALLMYLYGEELPPLQLPRVCMSICFMLVCIRLVGVYIRVDLVYTCGEEIPPLQLPRVCRVVGFMLVCVRLVGVYIRVDLVYTCAAFQLPRVCMSIFVRLVLCSYVYVLWVYTYV